MSGPDAQLMEDERGQLGGVGTAAKVAVGVIVGVGILALMAGILLPVGIDGIVDDETYTETQDVGEVVNVTSTLDSTLDSTDTGGDNATYTLSGPDSSVSHTVDNGTTQDFALTGGTVTVGVEDVESSAATANYTVPKDFGWSSGASSIWFILDVAVILAVILAALGLALKATDRL